MHQPAAMLSPETHDTFSAAGLDVSDVAAFRRDGFLICRWPLFAPAMLDRLRGIADAYVAEVAAGRRPADLNQPHFNDPRLFQFLLDGRALDIAERLVGPDILLWSSQFFCKPAISGRSVPWHADGRYWTNFIEPVQVVSVYIALDDQRVENGCLRLLLGSHRRDVAFPYERSGADANPFFPLGVPADKLDPAQIVEIELRAGEFVLFDGWLLHGSNANTSPDNRYSFTMRYAPTTCRVDAVSVRPVRRRIRSTIGFVRRKVQGRDIYRHRVYLVRGRDRAGNHYQPLP